MRCRPGYLLFALMVAAFAPGLTSSAQACESYEVTDCGGSCAPDAWVGDGVCDDGTYAYQGNNINLACELHDFDGGDCATGGCPDGQVADCAGQCSPANWLGDGICDDGAWEFNGHPVDFSCSEQSFDNGDCAPPACAADEMLDCFGHCAPIVWHGDGICDDGAYSYGDFAIVLDCPELEADNGDCGLAARWIFDRHEQTVTGGFGAGGVDLGILEVHDTTELKAATSDVGGGCTVDTVLNLYRVEASGPPTLVQSADSGAGGVSCAALDVTLSPGTYKLQVAGQTGQAIAAYSLSVSLWVSLSSDANIDRGDPATIHHSETRQGGYDANGSDRFELVIDETTWLVVQTYVGPDRSVCPLNSFEPANDTKLEIDDGTQVVASADNGGPGLCSLLDVTLEPGTYSLVVSGHGFALPGYSLLVQYGAPHDPTLYSIWRPGEPDGVGGWLWSYTGQPGYVDPEYASSGLSPTQDVHCATMIGDNYEWADDNCALNQPYACRNTVAPFDWQIAWTEGPWEDGVQECPAQLGATYRFGVPLSDDEATTLLYALDGSYVWINLSNASGSWQPLGYMYANWAAGQPDAADPVTQGCVAFSSDGHWSLETCNDAHRYACQSADDAQAWQLTTATGMHHTGWSACATQFGDGNVVFGLPQSPDSNAALAAALSPGDVVWINLMTSDAEEQYPRNVAGEVDGRSITRRSVGSFSWTSHDQEGHQLSTNQHEGLSAEQLVERIYEYLGLAERTTIPSSSARITRADIDVNDNQYIHIDVWGEGEVIDGDYHSGFTDSINLNVLTHLSGHPGQPGYEIPNLVRIDSWDDPHFPFDWHFADYVTMQNAPLTLRVSAFIAHVVRSTGCIDLWVDLSSTMHQRALQQLELLSHGTAQTDSAPQPGQTLPRTRISLPGGHCPN